MDSTDRMRTLRWACLLLSVYGVSSVEKDPGWPDTFVGAVFEFAVKDSDHSAGYSRTEALQHMERSLEAFEEAARDAKRQGAQIIVFPEYGLFGINFTRTSMYPYLEEVPDPNITSWNPCLEPQRFDNTEVLFRFSCMAKENDLFVVGNMGSVEPCTSQSHPNCPSDGRFQFNTNVAFNSDGLLISRYRKYNLYFEDHYYNTPNQVDYAIFNTPFAGNFAMFICYDLLFGSPAMELVKRYGVQNIAFSTAWFDHLPLFSSIQAQRAFSAGFGITLLASNLNIPEKGAFGSGIYFPGGSKYRHANGSHLLVAHVPLWSKDALSQEIPFTEKKINQWEGYSHTVDVEKTGEEPPFNQIMIYDEHTMVSLSGDRGKRRICHGDVCCSVKYQRTTNSSELYALAAYDGMHTIRQVFYHQICTLLRCAGSRRESCGKPTSHAVTTFNFELWGNFRTKYVLPAILTDGMHLQEPDSFGQLKDGRYSIAARMSEGLVTAMLYGRAYDKD